MWLVNKNNFAPLPKRTT